ncbi:MAG: hypothetical protein INR70_08885 [Parafilimonas terrae]|nr:hypothetical protein [Parafilimonas terrae]
MSELVLNPSETRSIRTPSRRRLTGPVVIGVVGAAALGGFAMAASSVIGDLIAVPVKTVAPVIDRGLASKWPDLKDGLPAIAGATTKPKPVIAETVAATPPGLAPGQVASLTNLPAAILAASPQASVTPAPQRKPEPPTVRIPVPTEVAVNLPPNAAKPVMPSRTAALQGPRETIRARDETPPAPQEAATRPREETAKPREAVAEKRPAAPKPAIASAAPKPAVASAAPTPDKARKAVAAHKPAPAAHQEAKTTTVASAAPETEETNILGVKLPSLAPAGRKIQESVSALGDAVRNAF